LRPGVAIFGRGIAGIVVRYRKMKLPYTVILCSFLFACGSSDSRTGGGGTAGGSSGQGGGSSTGGTAGTTANTGGTSADADAGMGGSMGGTATGGAGTGGTSTGGAPAAGGSGGTPVDTVPGVMEAFLNSQKTVFGSILGSRSDTAERFTFSVSGSIKMPFNRTFALSIDVPRGVESGTFSCVVKPTGTFSMTYLAEDGLYSSAPNRDCSATFSKIPKTGAGRLVGTFNGLIMGPTPIVVAGGVVDVPVQ
jgi:hypothetical protein